MKKQRRTLVGIASWIALLLGGMSSAHAFTLITYDGVPARWAENKDIVVEIDTDFHPYIDEHGCDNAGSCTNMMQVVENAFDAWKDVSKTDIRLSRVLSKDIAGTPHFDGKNQIKVYTQGWNNLPFNPPSSALAVTISTYQDPNTIVDSDIFFNAENFAWAVVDSDQERNVYDVQNVLTHEIGHFLGLDHTSENSGENQNEYVDATMFFASSPGETFRRNLGSLDELGIRHLYTSENMPAPVVDEVSPASLEIDSQNETIEIFGDNFLPTAAVIIVRNNDLGDLHARVVSVESDRIVAKVPSSNLQSGTYEIVVANSYDSFERLNTGLTVENPYVYGTYDQDVYAQSGGGGCASGNASSFLYLMLGVFGILITRKPTLQQ